MPNESDKTAETAPDQRDAEIKKLNEQLETLSTSALDLNKQLKQAQDALAKAEKKTKDAKSAPTGNVVYLDGVTYPVVKLIRAHQNDDEVKRGYVNEGATLVVIDRTH